MEGGTRTQFIKLLLLGACILKVAAKQFYFVSFDGSNNQNHQEVRDTGTNVDEDYYPNGLCMPKKNWASYCTEGYNTNDVANVPNKQRCGKQNVKRSKDRCKVESGTLMDPLYR